MARKARGGRGVMSPSAMDRLLLRRIENCKSNVPVLSPSHTDSIVDRLRSRFPEYGRLKLQPFTRRVHDVLLHLHPPLHTNGAAGDSGEEDDGPNGSSSRKRRGGGGGRDGDEERLLLAEEEHLRRKRKKRESTSSSVSSASNSSSTYSSEEEDAVFDAKLAPDFDITKFMLREKYKKQAVAAVMCRSEGKEDVVMEIENAVDKPKRRLLGSAGGRGIEETPAVARGGGEGDSGELDKGMETVPPRFKDFGGIKGVLEELTMEVIVPLLHPELPGELGVRPMAGILLHGPPGCGKTRLAHAIANETGVPFYRISATEVVSGVSGESEENIRNLFKKAYRTAPSIVFIDEIDAIASKRENLQKEMERRIVTQLMTCMDESHQTLKSASDSETSENKPGYVLVIGATNRPDAVDPALRRPGRFDHEIVLGVPDENARKEILTVFTKKLKLEGTFDLRKVAKSTPGFVGADLKALVDKAGRLAIRRINYRRKTEFYRENKENDEYAWVKQTWAPKEMVGLNITMVDFEEAAKLVQPSLRREGFSSIPAVKWDDVGGLDSIRGEFNRYIVRHIKNHEKYEKLGVTSETGFLLYGPPGCGKTLIAKAVANEAGANFIYIKGPELLSKYVGESELAIRTIFSRARTCSPCILFFDEMDALATKRGNDGGWVVERLLNQLLLELDGADERRGVYVIGATNRLEVVDPALLRPRRLGKLLYVPLPNEEERVLILKALVRKSPLANDVDLDRIGRSEACMNFSGADLGEVVKEAVLIASDEEDPVAIELENLDIEHSVIKASHFEQALKKVSPSVSEKERVYYEVLSRSFKVR